MTESSSALQDGERATTDMGWGSEYGPFHYRVLPEPSLSAELARQSLAKSLSGVDSVTLQPCPDELQRSQDRFVIQEWDLPSGKWSFTAVFDGHGGHDTADFTSENLPSMIKTSLSTLEQAHGSVLPPNAVSTILSAAISSLDDALAAAVIDLFPGGTETIAKLSDDDIRAVINDEESGGHNTAKALRCMRGTTVLVALVDPAHENLWVASLGDCIAVLQGRDAQSPPVVLSANHNGEDADEAARIRSEHPGEDEAILRNRVLGAIAVTRAVGDHLFKLPAIYTTRVFLNAGPGFRTSTPVHQFLPRNLTPPYLSNVADVRHVDLKDTREGDVDRSADAQPFLILASDGLTDLFKDRKPTLQGAVDVWAKVVANAMGSDKKENLALSVLRDALGGDDLEAVSRMLTVEMSQRWMDDTTILVQRL